jgi:serine/threonine protein kinase
MPIEDRRSERFGRYEILTELGRGAMGVVYKARDPKINRVVAVKTVSLAGQSPEEESEYRERFFREAEAAGRLSHPGIVTIFDVGEEPETRAPYIVMEFVGGQSLDALLSLDDHKLPVETALQLTLELAEALDCAHGQGVVHRDLKPANILLTEDGHAKIADFGVAKLNLANHTVAGRALGTPAYMSPEQLNGEAVDGRSDLFSLGVVLYTILTGYRPFQGNSAITVSFKVVNREPVPVTLLDTELPKGLDYIIARAMAKDPAERYQRGMEMVLDIQELQKGREPWSKAKLPASPTAKGAGKAAIDREGVFLGSPWIALKILQRAKSLKSGHEIPETPPGRTWKKSTVGILVLVGLLFFMLWGISLGSRRVFRTAGPLPSSLQTAPIVTPATPAQAPGSAATSVTSGLAPGLSDSHTPVSAEPTVPSPAKAVPVKVARAATLVIEIDHKFAEAHLSIWVDDRLTYQHVLEGTDKKHLVLFHQVQGHETHAMQLSAGKHRLRANVTSAGSNYDRSATIAGQFVSGQENVLRINFDKAGEMNLSLQ